MMEIKCPILSMQVEMWHRAWKAQAGETLGLATRRQVTAWGIMQGERSPGRSLEPPSFRAGSQPQLHGHLGLLLLCLEGCPERRGCISSILGSTHSMPSGFSRV